MGLRNSIRNWRARRTSRAALRKYGTSLLGPGFHLSGKDLEFLRRDIVGFLETKNFNPAQMFASLGNSPQWSAYAADDAVANGVQKSVHVYRCTTLKAQSCGSVPFRVMVRDGDDWVREEGALQALIDKPNHEWTWMTLIMSTSYHTDLGGTSYWVKCRADELAGTIPSQSQKGRSVPVAIWAHPASAFAPVLDQAESNYIDYYKPERRELDDVLPEDMITIRLPLPDSPWQGLAPFESAWTDVQIGNSQADYQKYGMDNRAIVGGVLKLTAPTTKQRNVAGKDKLADAKAKFLEEFQGAQNAHGIFVTHDSGFEYTDIAKSAQDMEFINGRKMTRSNIYEAFGVPSLLGGGAEGSTYANLESSQQQLWIHTLLPWLALVRDELNKELVPEFQMPGEELRIDFDLSGIQALWQFYNARVDTAVKLVGAGVPWANADKACTLALEPWEGWDAVPATDAGVAMVESLSRLGYSGNEINKALRLGLPELPHNRRFAPANMLELDDRCEPDFRGRK